MIGKKYFVFKVKNIPTEFINIDSLENIIKLLDNFIINESDVFIKVTKKSALPKYVLKYFPDKFKYLYNLGFKVIISDNTELFNVENRKLRGIEYNIFSSESTKYYHNMLGYCYQGKGEHWIKTLYLGLKQLDL